MRRFIAVATTAVALLAASSASAASGTLTVKSIDTSKFPTVAVTVATTTAGNEPQFNVTENGRPAVNVSSGGSQAPAAVALLVDTSRSMAGKKMHDAIASAKSFINEQRPGNILGVYGFGAKPYLAASLSNDPTQSDAAIGQLNVNGPPGTALYGAVVMASNDLKSQAAQKKVIVLLTDGQSAHDDATANQALAAAKADGVTIYTIGIATDARSSAALQALSGPTHGTSAVATSSGQLASLYRNVSDSLGSTYTFTYESLAQPGTPIHLTVSAPGFAPVTSASTAPGHAVVNHGGSGGGFKVPTNAAGRMGLALIAGLIVLLATLALLGAKPSFALHKRIAAHTESRKQAAVEGDNPANERLSAMQSLFIATEKIIGSMNFWQRMAANLERADLPLRTAELFYIQLASALFLGVMCALLLGQKGILTLIAMIIGATVPALVVRFKAHQRLGKFEHQLAETLITMAASLKAGHAFNQAIQSVVKEGADPTSKEFARVVAETQLGMPAEAALEAMAQRMNSYNFGFVVMAVNIQRTVGGSLADILDMVSDTVRQRQQFERKVKALTAQGRMSAYVLLAMPFLMALAIFGLNRAYIMILFTSSAGRILIGIALVMMSIGAVIIKKIVSFKG